MDLGGPRAGGGEEGRGAEEAEMFCGCIGPPGGMLSSSKHGPVQQKQ